MQHRWTCRWLTVVSAGEGKRWMVVMPTFQTASCEHCKLQALDLDQGARSAGPGLGRVGSLQRLTLHKSPTFRLGARLDLLRASPPTISGLARVLPTLGKIGACQSSLVKLQAEKKLSSKKNCLHQLDTEPATGPFLPFQLPTTNPQQAAPVLSSGSSDRITVLVSNCLQRWVSSCWQRRLRGESCLEASRRSTPLQEERNAD